MAREFTPAQSMERSILKQYRERLWTPFTTAVKRYRLIAEGDRIAACISGGKDSMLMAKLLGLLQRFSDYPFEVVYLVMDPGYAPQNRRQIEENAKRMEIPVTFFETDIFHVANRTKENPCYLCARMRRGSLYAKAKELGCNKIALGHHKNDVIETTLMGILYGAQVQGMLPRLRSTNFEGMELIRPLYCVREDDILAWKNYHNLTFLQCACRFTEAAEQAGEELPLSKRKEVKELIATLRKTNPQVEDNIFNSIHRVSLDTMVGYKQDGVLHSFLERL